ncbi:MAG: hypothetical protein ACOC3D_01885 [Pseudomonadota bacterium]
MSHARPLTLTLALVTLPAAALAQPAAEGGSSWRFQVGGGYLHQFETDVDDGGTVTVDRAYANAGVTYAFDRRTAAGLVFSYRFDAFDFGGSGALSGLDPWSDVQEVRLLAPVRLPVGERLDAFVSPQIAWSAETGAGFGDAFQAGATMGATYTVNDRLRLGAGLGVFSEIEDDASFFPLVLIDWRITDSFRLTTTPSISLTRGPTLNAVWEPSDTWSFTLGGGYESYRFRLEEEDRIGEERAFPLFAAATYEPLDDVTASLVGGVGFGGELKLDDSDGRTIAEEDFDPAPFLGFTLRARF